MGFCGVQLVIVISAARLWFECDGLSITELPFRSLSPVRRKQLDTLLSLPRGYTVGVGSEVVLTLAHDASLHFCRAR